MNREANYRQQLKSLSVAQRDRLIQKLDYLGLTGNTLSPGHSPSAASVTPRAPQLVAYVVANQQSETLDSAALKTYLKARLSSAMLPTAFVQLNHIPRTANGKVDANALPVVAARTPSSDTATAQPRTDTEAVLARIWSEVLHLDSIGIYDDFFDLGGNSILNIQIISRIRDAGFNLHPSQFAQYSNIAELAALLDHASSPTDSTDREIQSDREIVLDAVQAARQTFPDPDIYDELLAIVAGRQGHRSSASSLMTGVNIHGSRPPIFWCMNGWNGFIPIVKYLDPEQPIYGMESGYHVLRDRNASAMMAQSNFIENARAIAAHHVRELLEVQPSGPYILVGHSFGSIMAFLMASELHSTHRKVAFLGLIDTYGPHSVTYRALRPIETFYLNRQYNWRYFNSLQRAQRLEYLNTRLRSAGVDFLKNARSRWQQTLALNRQALKRSTPEPSLTGDNSQTHLSDLQVIKQLLDLNFATKIEQLHVFLARAERSKHPFRHVISPYAGWSTEAAANIQIHHCPGNHWEIVIEPHVRELAQQLTAAIAPLTSAHTANTD